MTDKTKQQLFIIAASIMLIAFVYTGLKGDSTGDELSPSEDLTMEERLLIEREQASRVKVDDLTAAVDRKLSRKTEAHSSVERETPVRNQGESPKNLQSPKSEPYKGSHPPRSDPLCAEIIRNGGICEPSKPEPEKEKNDSHIKQASYRLPSGTQTSSAPTPPASEPKKSRFAQLSRYYGKESRVDGASRVADVRVIKAGCTMLAQLETGITVTSEARKGVTFRVRGPLNGCELPEGFALKLVGTAKLNAIQKGITVAVDTCTSAHSDVKSARCSAAVESITARGGDLEGEVYDQSGWGIFWDAVLLIGTAPTLAKLTETANTASNLWAAETSRQVADTFSNALQRASSKITKTFEGREITVRQGVFVKVKILEDFVY